MICPEYDASDFIILLPNGANGNYILNKHRTAQRNDHLYNNISPEDRTICLSWIAQLFDSAVECEDYGIRFIAYLLFDNYLNCHNVPRDKYQLVAVVAFLLASKMGDVSYGIDYLAHICKDIYTRNDILQMEKSIWLHTGANVLFLTAPDIIAECQIVDIETKIKKAEQLFITGQWGRVKQFNLAMYALRSVF